MTPTIATDPRMPVLFEVLGAGFVLAVVVVLLIAVLRERELRADAEERLDALLADEPEVENLGQARREAGL